MMPSPVRLHIYSHDTSSALFHASYNAKRLLDDSIERTLKGYEEITEGSVVTGAGNILLARVESVAAFAFVALSATFMAAYGIILTPFVLIPTITSNILSRLPKISSFESVQEFTRECNHHTYRTLRIYALAIPVIFLFLSASGTNTVLPGVLKPRNVFFDTIHKLVAPLGPLQTIRAIVPGVTDVVGTKTESTSPLSEAEDYIRALSNRNYLTIVTTFSLIHHRKSTTLQPVFF